VIDQLALHGIRPLDHTPPTVVRGFLNDQYTYELRRLRSQLVRREFPKASYAGRVIAIRQRYPLLSVPLEHWLEPQATGAEPGPRPRSPSP
jgi:hypothetical protein